MTGCEMCSVTTEDDCRDDCPSRWLFGLSAEDAAKLLPNWAQTATKAAAVRDALIELCQR